MLASANLPALVLAAAAIIAIFRLKLGPLPVLALCSALGAGYWLVAGSNPA